jgi:hypothetical protein
VISGPVVRACLSLASGQRQVSHMQTGLAKEGVTKLGCM